MRILVEKLHLVLARIEDWAAILIFFTLLALSIIQILVRNILGSGIVWTEAGARVLVLWLALAGALLACRKHQHIKIDLLSHLLGSETAKQRVGRCLDLVAMFITGYITYVSVLFVIDEKSYGMIAFAQVPVWICELMIPISFAMMTLHYLLFCVFGTQEGAK